MHRLIACSVMLFWAVMFGGLAHLALSGILHIAPANAVEFQLLFSKTSGLQVMPVLLMVVSALFGWALLALAISDFRAFREVEAHSYAAAIFVLSACAVLAFVKLGLAATVPAILAAALATTAAASHNLSIEHRAEAEPDHGRQIARRMALGAAHNSLLSRVSGRPVSSRTIARNNVTPFPTKPLNGDRS